MGYIKSDNLKLTYILIKDLLIGIIKTNVIKCGKIHIGSVIEPYFYIIYA